MGLRDVNSDMAFEKGLKQAGLSLKMPEDEEEKEMQLEFMQNLSLQNDKICMSKVG